MEWKREIGARVLALGAAMAISLAFTMFILPLFGWERDTRLIVALLFGLIVGVGAQVAAQWYLLATD